MLSTEHCRKAQEVCGHQLFIYLCDVNGVLINRNRNRAGDHNTKHRMFSLLCALKRAEEGYK